MRRAGARAAIALAASGVTVLAFVWASTLHLPVIDSVLVFMAPPLIATAALATSALLPARLLASGRRSSADLTPRSAWASAPRSWFVVCGALTTVLLALLVAGVLTAGPVFFVDARGLAMIAGAVVLLLAATWIALVRVARRPAFAVDLAEVDAAIRGAVSRLVLTISAGALLAEIALLSVYLGDRASVWAMIAGERGVPVPLLTVVGDALMVVAAAAAVATVAAVVAAFALAVGFLRAAFAAPRVTRTAVAA